MRHQRAPPREARPAQIADGRLLRKDRDLRPGVGRILRVEREPIGERARALERAGRASRHQTSVGRLESRNAATALFI